MDDLIIYAAMPVFTVTMLLEFWALKRRANPDDRGYERRDSAASLSMGFGSLLVNAGMDLVLIWAASRLFVFAAWEIPGTWWGWLLAFALVDLAFYWLHRFHHEVRFMWASHINHHSSQHYNLSTALRQSWTEPLTGLPFYLPVALLGVRPEMMMVCWAINLLYQYWVHTEAIQRLGAFGWVFNTPSHHRVHHGSDALYLDRNYAGVFIIWDRLFGTFEPENARPTYGLVKNISTFNPLRIAFHEWAAIGRSLASATSWRDRWMLFAGPPGWSADGSTQTATELRAQALRGD